MALRTELVIGKSHVLSKILILLSIVCHDMQGCVSGSQAGPHDSWPFSDLNAININVHGNVINTTSPVGQGLYLDGSSNTYVEIKGYDSSCMDDPSKCDLTIGFFFKYTSHSQHSKETYFGNKDNNEDLYRGINIHFNKSGPHHEYNMSVYGKDRYCECRIYPFYGVWQYIGLIWEKPGNLTVYHDGWITHAYQNPKRCTCCQSPNGLKKGRYYLGKDTFPNAYYKDLVIWYSKQERTVLDERWDAPFDNGGDTEITLKIDFWELPYDASKANQWEKSFNHTVLDLYHGRSDVMEILQTSVSDSGGNASITFTLKFSYYGARVSWDSLLVVNLALENRTFLGSYGVFDEASCTGGDNFICQVPKNRAATSIHHNRILIAMDSVETAVHEDYLYSYQILFKKLDDPDSAWERRYHRRNPPIHKWITSLTPHTNYTFRVMAVSFQSEGLISEPFVAKTLEYYPGAPPQSLVAYSTSITSLFAYWEEVEESKHHGIMRGFKVTISKSTNQCFQYVDNRAYNWSVRETNFTGLKPFTKYKIAVLGFNTVGDGPARVVEVWTEELYPSKPPDDIEVVHQGSTELLASWNEVPECYRLGIILGYHVILIDPTNVSVSETITTTKLFHRFTNLKKFHEYNVTLEAFTTKGVGPRNYSLAFTDQDVPDAPPQDVVGYNISQTEILVSWNPVPIHKVNGIVTQHKVSFSKISGGSSGHKLFNASIFQGVIERLSPFTVYAISVSAATIKGYGPTSVAINVTTEEEAPKVSPGKFQGLNASSTSIALSWDPFPPSQVAGVLRYFHITYHQLNTDDNTTHNIAVPITNLSLVITNLRKYTNYSLEIKGATKFPGINSQPIIVSTDEDVPSLPPQDIKAQNSSSTKIFVQWDPIPNDFIHGILRGIKLLYRPASRDNSLVFRLRARRSFEEDWPSYTNITLPPNATSYELISLNKFTNYTIVLVGFTSKGDGNFSRGFIVSTDEDIPSKPPSGFSPWSHSGAFTMEVTWGQVPDGFVHGILRGYRIYIWKIEEEGKESHSETRVITYGPNVSETVISVLTNFATYNLEMTAFTIKGEGPRSAAREASTCKCPKEFRTTWYHFPPYISFDNGTVGGFIPQILELAVQACCSDCTGPNGKSISTVNFELDGKGNAARKPGVKDLISSIDARTDLSVPMNGYELQTHYSLYRYVKLAESPGVAFITVTEASKKAVAIANMFFYSWPLLILAFLMTLLAGIIMSFLEISEGKIPKTYLHGAYEGFWWAFVTSSTVGYGDRCPSGVASRFFGMVWTLSGLVIIIILIGSIATKLTHFGYVGPYIALYGTQVAAISNNSDFRLGIRKNAKVNKVREYLTYEEISEALGSLEVKGALVDLYVLSTHKHLFEDPRFRIVRVYDHKSSYGAVLAGHSMKLHVCFSEKIKEDAANVYKSIEENIKILKQPEDSPGEQQSTELFNASSPRFITAAVFSGSLLILASVAGLIYEMCRDKSHEGLLQSKDLKNELAQIVDDFLANMKKIVQEMAKRHRRQHCQIVKAEKERHKQAEMALNHYYDFLSSRDIRQGWNPRTDSTENAPRTDCDPTVWPFSSKDGEKLTVPSRIPKFSPPLNREKNQGEIDFSAAFTLEPKIRVVEETKL